MSCMYKYNILRQSIMMIMSIVPQLIVPFVYLYFSEILSISLKICVEYICHLSELLNGFIGLNKFFINLPGKHFCISVG